MNGRVRELMKEMKEGLRDLYGARLRGVFLFGSYARGEEDAESDVDVLAVLDRIDRYAAEVDRASALASALSLQHGVSISTVFVAEEAWRGGDTPFLENVRREAVAA